MRKVQYRVLKDLYFFMFRNISLRSGKYNKGPKIGCQMFSALFQPQLLLQNEGSEGLGLEKGGLKLFNPQKVLAENLGLTSARRLPTRVGCR